MVVDDIKVINDILTTSIRNNERQDITGALLYLDGGILQVLEGRRGPLYDTFDAIVNDDRHTGMIVLLEKAIAVRSFSDWRMGFKKLTKLDFDPSVNDFNVFEFNPRSFANLRDGNEALSLINSFTSSYEHIHPRVC